MNTMKRMAVGFLAGLMAATGARADDAAPKIEVAFVLDTTGSMSGLIEDAKQKIWAIANEVATAKPTPELKVALVAYRDQGDDYVTKVFDFTDDIDKVFETLMGFRADGGGDTPEHVNQAVADAVDRLGWSADEKTLKLMYLVGDAPPHMDYKDGTDYAKSVEQAVRKGIIVNTLQCGADGETTKVWKEIARLGEGEYKAIQQGTAGPVVSDASTPVDGEIMKLREELGGTALAMGGDGSGRIGGFAGPGGAPAGDPAACRPMAVPATGACEPPMAPECEADGASGVDLIDAIAAGSVKLDDLKDEELPEAMRSMSADERKSYIAEQTKKRQELREKLAKLETERARVLADKAKDALREAEVSKDEKTFDGAVMESLKRAAEKKGIEFAK